MTSRNVGRFEVSEYFFEDTTVDEGINLFRDMIVLDVSHDLPRRTRTYLAIHRDFRTVAQGEMVPKYKAYFRSDSSTPEWREVTRNEQSESSWHAKS